MESFTNQDLATLLSQPGFFGYRSYQSVSPFTKAVFANGATYSMNTDVSTISFEDVGDLYDQVANETATISISSGRVLDADLIYALTGGLYQKVVTPGTLVSGASQTVASGNWVYGQILKLTGQNYDLAKPAITSVTGSVDGALVVDTDYDMVFLPELGWGVSISDSVSVTTEVQDIVVVYSYTPTASTKLTRGGTKIITPIELCFQTTNDDGTFNQFVFYKCSSDGSDGHGFGSENSADPITMDLSFSAKKDTNRTTGDQLYSKEFNVTTSLFA